MTFQELQLALALLVGNGFKLPHGLLPGSYPGGTVELTTEEKWDAYQWNPPGYMPDDTGYDQDAGQKPPWSGIVVALESALREQRLAALELAIKGECARRINRLFDATNDRGEIWERLAGGNTPERLTERSRLLGVNRALRAAVGNLEPDELAAFDPATDAHWEAPAQ